MSILDITNLEFSYGDKNLFNSLDMRLFNLDHLGLIGMNGVGKTTLIKLIAGIIDPDKGSIKWQENISYSYLDQNLEVSSDISILEYLHGVYDHLFIIEERINELYKSLEVIDESGFDKVLKRADNLTIQLEENDFYLIKSKIENVLSGLGIIVSRTRLLKDLSGGERAKVFLAKMLLEEKDILLLDEPTNFLDQEHVDWLSKYLVNYPKAYIVISHNTTFLNSVVNKIAEIDNKQLSIYKGDYNYYLKEKALRQKQYEDDYQSQQKYIKKTTEFIEKNIARSSTSKRAKSRRKQLEKLDVLEKPVYYKDIKFNFPYTRSFNKEALVIKDLEIGYDHRLLDKINLKVNFGDRLLIRGENGVGKTTFIKTLLNIIPSLGGSIFLNELNDIAYYSQELTNLKEITAIEYIREAYPLKEDEEIRSLLASYGLNNKLVIKTMNKLSGGELTKVRFALLSLSKSNLLILDEPTNHLDKIAKAALLSALSDYHGTIILISHEREFFKELQMKEIEFKR